MARKFCSLIILMAFLLIPAIGFSDEKIIGYHPILSEKNWVYDRSETDSVTDSDGTSVVYNKTNYFRHPTNDRWFMLEDEYFGERVLRVFLVMDESGQEVYSFIHLEKDGVWHDVSYVSLSARVVRDFTKKITAILFVVRDENGKEIVRREVKRKDVAPAAISEMEKELMDKWIQDNSLNNYGDLHGEVYMGGTPLFNEKTGKRTDRYEYILKNHPDRPWLKNQK